MTRTTCGSMSSASRACSIAHNALPGEPQPRASTIAMSRSPSAATSGARSLYRASMGAHRSDPQVPREVAVANRPRCEPGRAGLRNRAGRQAPRSSPCRTGEDEVVPEPERRQNLRQRGVVDHLLQVAGHPRRLGAGRSVAAGRRHRIAAGPQQQVGQLVGHVIGKVVVGQPRPSRLFRGAPVGTQVAEDRAVALLDALDGCRDLRPVLLPEGVEGVSEPAA